MTLAIDTATKHELEITICNDDYFCDVYTSGGEVIKVEICDKQSNGKYGYVDVTDMLNFPRFAESIADGLANL